MNVPCLVLRRKNLLELRRKARRCGAWFRTLSRIDRALIDSTINVADEVRSFVLANALLLVVKKLENAIESKVLRVLKEVGLPLAHKLSLLAQKWGNRLARDWAFDGAFAKFLAIMHINDP